MPIIGSEGAASSKGFGQFALSTAANYIEECFSCFLYTGNGSTQTITNGIDLSGKGGLTWIKARDIALSNWLFDTQRGSSNRISSNSTSGQVSASGWIDSFNANGFTLGSNGNVNGTDVGTGVPYNYVSWTFRKQPKFFDVVTYTGTGSSRTVAHNLGSVPGCIIVKEYSAVDSWYVYHQSLGATKALLLDQSLAADTSANYWSNTEPTATQFTVGAGGGVNQNTQSYVAYLFAHDAGGFGLTGTDNVISCGSYTGNGSATGPVISLGYEPQWLMVKNASGTGNWNIIDSMRGMTVGGTDAFLEANTADAEATADWVSPTATGFQITSTSSEVNTSSSTYIYIAIRRGPMKVPTTGTSVFAPIAITPTNNAIQSMNFASDMNWARYRDLSGNGTMIHDRLRGFAYGTATSGSQYPETGRYLQTTTTDAENNNINPPVYNVWNDQLRYGNWAATTPTSFYNFRRAPGFFDEVCYTGTGASTFAVTHNLGVKPELAIIKCRTSGSTNWIVGVQGSFIDLLRLNTTEAILTSVVNSNFTSTTFVTGAGALGANETTISSNGTGNTYVAYLFATCPGVSKVGSFTGTGATQVINCGFTGGARFVLIKATSTTGNWLVWDSARGIVAGNDPYLALNSTAAEVTTTDWVDTAATGFELSNAGGNLANSSGVSYIFLAIA